MSVEEKYRHQFVQLLCLFRCFNDRITFMERKADQLVCQAQQIRVANFTGHIERQVIVLRHGNHIFYFLQQRLRLFRLSIHGLGNDDRQQIRPFRP